MTSPAMRLLHRSIPQPRRGVGVGVCAATAVHRHLFRLRMSAASPDFLALADTADPIAAAICKRPPEPTTTAFGINATGQLYIYGPTPQAPQQILDPDEGLQYLGILDGQLRHYAGRDYFVLRLQSMVPLAHYSLRLPAYGSRNPTSGDATTQWSVRSALGALLAAARSVDLRATPGKLCARRGTGGSSGFSANFIDLFLPTGPEGQAERVYADAIGPTRHDLEIAVNQLRRALDLDPQFP